MIIKAILKIDPNAQFSVSGSNIDTCQIIWHDGNPNNITKADIEAKIAELPTAEEERIAKENLKASAKAKLIAGEPLTEEEANTIVL